MVSAGAGSGAGIAYLYGGEFDEVEHIELYLALKLLHGLFYKHVIILNQQTKNTRRCQDESI